MKIRYRLVYRHVRFDRLGRSLVQIEARMGKKRMLFTTRVYIRQDQWDGLVVNHENADVLNAYLVRQMIDLERIEMNFFRVGVTPSLEQIREAYKTDANIVDFVPFATQVVETSERKPATKENLLGTIKKVRKFRRDTVLRDIDYGWLKDFEIYLRNQGVQTNTITKQMQNVRTLLSEALRRGYIEKDPFLMYQKPRLEQKEHVTVNEEELARIEKVTIFPNERDAFLYVARYCGLRYSDYQQLGDEHFVKRNGDTWIVMKTQKTGAMARIPIEALGGLDAPHPKLPCNSETNRHLKKIMEAAGIKKRVTMHTARHSFATNLLTKGVDLTTISSLLSHKGTRMTEHYSEVKDIKIESDIKRVLLQKD